MDDGMQFVLTLALAANKKEVCVLARPHPGLLPGEKEPPWRGFDFSVDCSANPVARIFKKPARVSPSPWGEGRDEGGC
jgi:hypothetical protein